jgi:CheY-like chemotaxis protein
VDFKIENLGGEDGMVDVKFTVSDTGIGISEEGKAKIFEPFEQSDSKISNKYGGTGLGLAISGRIVGLMGGSIEVESEQGKGSTFTFTISMKEVYGPVISDVTYTDAIGKFRDKRALIVDDIEVNRMVVAGLLEDTGIRIDEAADGVEAVEKFSASADGYYDIIFMDVQMPRMDGYAAASVIRAMQDRKDAREIAIVALTANAFKEDIERAKEAGMNTHIAKPVDADRLVEVLFGYLA